MTADLAIAIARVAPWYNLLFVIIAVWFFVRLFETPVRNLAAFQKPWKWIFISLLFFVVEEVITVLRAIGIVNIPAHINGFFELFVVGCFIYALMLQKEQLKQH